MPVTSRASSAPPAASRRNSGASSPRPVKKYASWLRREWSNPRSVLSSDVTRWQRCRNAVAVACAACLPTAAALAPELTRDSLSCFDHAFDVHDACGLPATVSAVLRGARRTVAA